MLSECHLLRSGLAVRGGRTGNKNWLEDCYWHHHTSGLSRSQPVRPPDPSHHQTQPVRSLRSENHIRVMALNNQFSLWKQSNNITHQNLDQNILESGNIGSSFQDFKSETILEEIDEITQYKSSTPPQVKVISKLPFTANSYRNHYK